MGGGPGRFTLFWKTLDIGKLLRDPVYRASRWLYLTSPGEQQQVTTYTEVDRYPLIFEGARTALAGRAGPLKLLSYGCSTGEEVASLRDLFPDAEIVGADINPAALEQAHRRHSGPRTQFVSSRSDELVSLGPFDAIFCMAVLQRFPSVVAELDSLADVYPYAQFRDEVSRLHGLVAEGGILVLHLTHYRFADLELAASYETVPTEIDRPWNPVTFRPDGSRIRKGYRDVIFRRRANRDEGERA